MWLYMQLRSHPFLPLIVQWIEKVIGWLSRVFLQDGPSAQSSPEASSTLKRWRCHVQRFFYRIYASMRIEELFSIIRGASPLGWDWVGERSLSCATLPPPASPQSLALLLIAAWFADFPESKPAVEDLKFCLERTNQRQQLLSSLKSALEMRLLHPGGFYIPLCPVRSLGTSGDLLRAGLVSCLRSEVQSPCPSHILCDPVDMASQPPLA